MTSEQIITDIIGVIIFVFIALAIWEKIVDVKQDRKDDISKAYWDGYTRSKIEESNHERGDLIQ